jgi:hypothetical protein
MAETRNDRIRQSLETRRTVALESIADSLKTIAAAWGKRPAEEDEDDAQRSEMPDSGRP